MTEHHAKARALSEALAKCGPLREPSPNRDQLWFVVRDTVCTKEFSLVIPLGSSSLVPVTSEHATDELLAAMEWLTAHEGQARRFSPTALFVRLRGVATRGGTGSARAAQADALHGLTQVSPGQSIVFTDEDCIEDAS